MPFRAFRPVKGSGGWSTHTSVRVRGCMVLRRVKQGTAESSTDHTRTHRRVWFFSDYARETKSVRCLDLLAHGLVWSGSDPAGALLAVWVDGDAGAADRRPLSGASLAARPLSGTTHTERTPPAILAPPAISGTALAARPLSGAAARLLHRWLNKRPRARTGTGRRVRWAPRARRRRRRRAGCCLRWRPRRIPCRPDPAGGCPTPRGWARATSAASGRWRGLGRGAAINTIHERPCLMDASMMDVM